MRKEKDNEKNFKLPRIMFLVWMKGFLNGRTGTAVLSSEQVVQSGYIQRFQKKFEGYTAEQMKKLDKKLHLLSAEAEKLFLEAEHLKKPVSDYKPAPEGASVIQERAAARDKANVLKERYNRSSRQKQVKDRLVEIRSEFSELETACQETLLQAAAEIEAVFATYCKGVLFRKPLLEKNIPKIYMSDTITNFHKSVEWTSRCLRHIDEEVNKNYEEA